MNLRPGGLLRRFRRVSSAGLLFAFSAVLPHHSLMLRDRAACSCPDENDRAGEDVDAGCPAAPAAGRGG